MCALSFSANNAEFSIDLLSVFSKHFLVLSIADLTVLPNESILSLCFLNQSAFFCILF